MNDQDIQRDFAHRLRAFIDFPGRSGLRGAPPQSDPDLFQSLALELFAFQFESNPSYRRFCERRRGIPREVDDWRRIPAVPAAAFKEMEMTCLSPERRTRVFHSSGTSERSRSRHFHSRESLAWYEASLLSWFEAHALSGLGKSRAGDPPVGTVETAVIPRMTFISLVPSPDLAPHSSLAHMCGAILRHFGSVNSLVVGGVDPNDSWRLDVDSALSALRALVAPAQPAMLLGTAFLFVHLLDALDDCGLRFELPPGSRVMETGGYKGRSRDLPKAELHRLITSRLGIPSDSILCEYGMSELSSQAYDLKLGGSQAAGPGGSASSCGEGAAPGALAASPRRVFHFPPWARALVVSPETGGEVGEGETGLIRVYDLANVYSVMAIQTEDLGVRRGDGFELVGRAALAEPRGCSLMSLGE
jgi:hypothetical protein